ncbi:MAG: hypothetical protein IKA23_05905 [Akkermansia sp.]|nr:hypothetical protein [Akkermansia sp.]MBR2314727.1 hypothetical protein [Akkermansia sp.]
MGKVTLELTESEMRDLAEVCAMSLTLLGQAMPDGRNPRADAWQKLLVEIVKAGRTVPGIARDMELNPDCGYWFFKRPYIDQAFYSDVLDEYRDAAFWEELVMRISFRTLVEYYGQDEVESMSPEERSSRTAALEKSLWEEVSRHGASRLLFMLPPEES